MIGHNGREQRVPHILTCHVASCVSHLWASSTVLKVYYVDAETVVKEVSVLEAFQNFQFLTLTNKP